MDDYIVAKTKEADFIGQLTVEEIVRQFHAGDLLGNYVATKSQDLSYDEIMQSDTATWITVADLVWNQLTPQPQLLVSFVVAKQRLAKSVASLVIPLAYVSFFWFDLLLPANSALHVGVSLCFIAVFPAQAGILFLLREPRTVKIFATCLRLVGAVLLNYLTLITLIMILRTWREASSGDPLVNCLFYFWLWSLTIAAPTFAVAHTCDGLAARYLTDVEQVPILSGLRKKIALGCGVTFLFYSWGVEVIEILTMDPTGVAVHLEAPAQVVRNGRFVIVARIKNTDKNPQTLVELDIADSYLTGITIERTEPLFSKRAHGLLATWVSYIFDRRVDPGGELVMILEARAAYPGNYAGPLGFCVNSSSRCLWVPLRTVVTETNP